MELGQVPIACSHEFLSMRVKTMFHRKWLPCLFLFLSIQIYSRKVFMYKGFYCSFLMCIYVFMCVCLNICGCICVWVYMHTCVCVYMEDRGWCLMSSSITIYLIYWGRVSRWTWNLPILSVQFPRFPRESPISASGSWHSSLPSVKLCKHFVFIFLLFPFFPFWASKNVIPFHILGHVSNCKQH